MQHALPSNQTEYWDLVARQKTFRHPLREIFDEHVPRNAAVLDIGCGYGRLVAELSERGYRQTIGIDSAAGMIERGLEERPELDLRYLDGPGLPFDDGSFGAVLLFTVLTCIPGLEDQRALLAEIRRVLTPGGVLYVSDMELQDDERNRERYSAGSRAYGEEGVFELSEGVVLCHLSEQRRAELFTGFEVIESTPLDVVTMNGNAARAFQFVGRNRA